MAKNIFSTDYTLGILGGGQLGKMMLYTTRKFDIRTKVLDPSVDAPAQFGANEFQVGSLQDYDTVMAFAADCDTICIEIEAVNVQALRDLRSQGKKVHPNPDSLELIQDKTRQKQFYADHNIPTSRFEMIDSKRGFEAARDRWPIPFVWKAATGGYDGFGVVVCRTENDVQNIPDVPGMLEAFVDFDLEVSVIVARNESGEIKTFPVADQEFHPTANQVEYVLCPTVLSKDMKEKAEEIAVRTAEAYDICGLLAVELFVTAEGEILVNEVAPRPHNSGHHTIEACYTSQFEQHVRAVLNLPLGSTELKAAGVMANLVGADGYSGNVMYQGYDELLAEPGVNIHIYGKAQTRPFRKMGHVTVVAKDRAEARKRAEWAKNSILVKSK
ncbi:MAG: 5-(carboxyamino)imidazole ribonucleotide synthase [Flavobacteriales bacterium]|jgi:5-(carboxyamino)imidazole ribonucleotide synthase|nr:5-(carboxyamino)imidazole ribonucleotide synthase [Flavobacteriales bacterium]|tara:strand:+ start:15989 stop:17143 length:1155 start_codon:yes stop_codon:yes gene_type:complete